MNKVKIEYPNEVCFSSFRIKRELIDKFKVEFGYEPNNYRIWVIFNEERCSKTYYLMDEDDKLKENKK